MYQFKNTRIGKSLSLVIVITLCTGLFLGITPLQANAAAIPPNNCYLPAFTNPPDGSLVVPATDETKVRYIGRAMPIDNAAYLAYPLSGMEFEVTDSTGVYIKLSPVFETNKSYNVAGYNLLAVFIDDSPSYVIYHLAHSKLRTPKYIRIAKFDQPGNHKIRMMKVTNPEVKLNITEVAASGNSPTITPSVKRDRNIEFVGDSITVSVDMMSVEEPQGRYNEAWQGYAGRTADYFNADVNLVAIGGGFLEDKDQIQNAHRYFYLVDPWRPTIVHGGQSDKYLWDFSRSTPDIVVVNLGTNLSFATDYMDYVNFYKRIRAKYADQSIPVLFALGAMWLDAYPQIEQAVDYIKNTMGDPNVYGMTLGDGYKAGGGHPNWEQHQLMANVLIPKIEEIIPEWKK